MKFKKGDRVFVNFLGEQVISMVTCDRVFIEGSNVPIDPEVIRHIDETEEI